MSILNPVPIDPEKRRQAMWLLRGEGWNFYNIARAFGTSLTEVRRAVEPRAAELHKQWSDR